MFIWAIQVVREVAFAYRKVLHKLRVVFSLDISERQVLLITRALRHHTVTVYVESSAIDARVHVEVPQ